MGENAFIMIVGSSRGRSICPGGMGYQCNRQTDLGRSQENIMNIAWDLEESGCCQKLYLSEPVLEYC